MFSSLVRNVVACKIINIHFFVLLTVYLVLNILIAMVLANYDYHQFWDYWVQQGVCPVVCLSLKLKGALILNVVILMLLLRPCCMLSYRKCFFCEALLFKGFHASSYILLAMTTINGKNRAHLGIFFAGVVVKVVGGLIDLIKIWLISL